MSFPHPHTVPPALQSGPSFHSGESKQCDYFVSMFTVLELRALQGRV